MTELSKNRISSVKWELKPLVRQFYAATVELANGIHGAGYLTEDLLAVMVSQGATQTANASFVAIVGEQVVAYRLSFLAGKWLPDEWCTQEQWPVPASNMAYFKSVAVSPTLQGLGIGQALLQHSIGVLRQQGATAGLAHLWRESPNNSAVRYFTKAGGELIKIHENRWQHLSAQGYACPRCRSLCCCSAAEMVLRF